MRKAQANRARALEEYFRTHLPSYEAWLKKRNAIAQQVRLEETTKRPEIWKLDEVAKACGKRMRQWDKANPSPLSWNERQRLEAEFRAEHIEPGNS